ncbi:hypothetical protein [Epilithonimonas xixisoli]|uniref:Uncharacterized protein n=1 Tax=Epilithonimonas xixisoli TaxID=1476462 RepID=A0A4R8IC19_9FLAO|nr:hypothetical protein [Epilithonimonas xixisoli]TDX87264.1 hypothetical protein B0I22_1452 [Epilithonimonas xixisoli]
MKYVQISLKNLFIIYVFSIAILALICKYYFQIIDEKSLHNAFYKYISVSFVIIFSSLVGVICYKFGFDNKENKFLLRIIGYFSFIGVVIFINICFCFIFLVSFNSILRKSNETYSFHGHITKVESYKLSTTISLYDKSLKETKNFSVNKDYTVGEYVTFHLKKGKFDIYYN